MNKTLWFLIIFALFLQSCKSTKHVQTGRDTVKHDQPTDTLDDTIQQRSSFEWFSANLNGSINLDGDRNSFGGQIRIKNGETIWISVTALGGLMEVARLLITTDSVFLYNKYEKTATIRDFSYFKELTGVAFTFNMLQDILLGNYDPNSELANELSARTVRLNYDGYITLENKLYPQNLSVQLTEPTALELRLNYQKIQLNVPQNMPFSIPESVKKI